APTQMPANVQQVMHVHGEPLLVANRASAGIDVQIPETFPANITAHPLTAEHLARSLSGIAGTLPRPEPTAAPPVAEDAPTPRPVIVRTDGPRDSWDFLKPVASLRGRMPLETATEPTPLGERTALRSAQPAIAE